MTPSPPAAIACRRTRSPPPHPRRPSARRVGSARVGRISSSSRFAALGERASMTGLPADQAGRRTGTARRGPPPGSGRGRACDRGGATPLGTGWISSVSGSIGTHSPSTIVGRVASARGGPRLSSGNWAPDLLETPREEAHRSALRDVRLDPEAVVLVFERRRPVHPLHDLGEVRLPLGEHRAGSGAPTSRPIDASPSSPSRRARGRRARGRSRG